MPLSNFLEDLVVVGSAFQKFKALVLRGNAQWLLLNDFLLEGISVDPPETRVTSFLALLLGSCRHDDLDVGHVVLESHEPNRQVGSECQEA